MNHATSSGAGSAHSEQAANGPVEMWLFTHDHRRIARAWAVTAAVALVAGVVLGLGLAFQPFASGVAADTFRRMYTMHGLALVALVVLPAIPGVLGNALLPAACGSQEMAWPGLNRLAFHVYLLGVVLFTVAFAASPADTGWSFDAPFAFRPDSRLAWSLLGLLAVGIAGACAGANAIATVVASRWRTHDALELPLFAWALVVAALVQILAAPILCAAVVLLVAQRAGAADVFGSGAVALDVRFAEWFWAWGHPAIAAAVIAALGLIDEVVMSHAARRGGASRAAVVCVLALGVLAFAGAPVHVLGRATSPADSASASALALAAGLPFAGLVAAWIVALSRSSPRPSGALCAAASAILLLSCGALAGLVSASVPAGVLVAQSSFASAQLHFVALGVVCALFAGLLHVAPEWFGAEAREGQSRAASVLVLAGAFGAFVPRLVLGWMGQPQRTTHIVAGGESLALASAVGGTVLVIGLALAAWSLVGAFLAARATGEPEAAR